MNLALDTGNTRVKAAVFDGRRIVGRFTAEAPGAAWLDEIFAAFPAIRGAIVASVRGGVEELSGLLAPRVERLVVFDHTVPVPIPVAYATPATLGRDRLAAAVGAAALYRGTPALIFDLGTAITVDLVEADGTFVGGNISPGAAARFRALHEFTGKLPLAALADTPEPLGTSTLGAIEAGVVHGIVYEIEGYMARYCKKIPNLRIVFTGGDANFFAKRLNYPIFASDDLVLYGLNEILEYNAR